MNVLFCTAPHGPPERTGYDHGLIALAEGLQALNRAGAQHRWSGTVPYWRQTPGQEDWLIPADGTVTWKNADVVVVSYLIWGDGGELPPELASLGSTKTVFLDAMDGWRGFYLRPALRDFDLVLRTHLSRRYRVPENVRPWTFGLTNRIIEACQPGSGPRNQEILFNFRVGHPLRDWTGSDVLPTLQRRFAVNRDSDQEPARDASLERLYWEQTGRRHYPTYFERLKTSLAGAAYGGYFAPRWPASLNSLLLRGLYRAVQQTRMRTKTVVQFDSWRLWETLAAGTLMIHVDLERYGATLPVPLVNRVHYWAISPDTARRDCEELLETPLEDLERIAEAGRLWALQHYGPEAQARRLMGWLGLQE